MDNVLRCSLIVVLLLLERTQLGDSCMHSWTLYPGMSSSPYWLSWIQQGAPSQYTEETCKAACVTSPLCTAVEYNVKNKTCWGGAPIYGRTKNSDVNHWILVRLNCGVTCTAATLITYNASTDTASVGPSGLVLQPPHVYTGYNTANYCQQICLANFACQYADFFNGSCWFGFTDSSTKTIVRVGYTHSVVSRTTGCGNCIAYRWTGYLDTKSTVAMYRYGQDLTNTELSCMRVCETMPSCTSIDFDSDTKACWMAVTESTQRINAVRVNHFELKRTPCMVLPSSVNGTAEGDAEQDGTLGPGGIAAIVLGVVLLVTLLVTLPVIAALAIKSRKSPPPRSSLEMSPGSNGASKTSATPEHQYATFTNNRDSSLIYEHLG